ncbi:MAG: hypothetical protein GY762_00130, partial [Proteobacteria bacterium]|nr:hypothetical protein [Pseudomonadota bacterium]
MEVSLVKEGVEGTPDIPLANCCKTILGWANGTSMESFIDWDHLDFRDLFLKHVDELPSLISTMPYKDTVYIDGAPRPKAIFERMYRTMVDTAVEYLRLKAMGLTISNVMPYENVRYYPLHEYHGPIGDDEPLSGPEQAYPRDVAGEIKEGSFFYNKPHVSYADGLKWLKISPDLASHILHSPVPLRKLPEGRTHILPTELIRSSLIQEEEEPGESEKNPMNVDTESPTLPTPPVNTTEQHAEEQPDNDDNQGPNEGHILLECLTNKYHFPASAITESCVNVIREDPSIPLDHLTPQTVVVSAPTTYMFIGPQDGTQMLLEMEYVKVYGMEEECNFRVIPCDDFGKVRRTSASGSFAATEESAAEKAKAIKARLEWKRNEEKSRTLMFYHNLTAGSLARSMEKGQLDEEVQCITGKIHNCLKELTPRYSTRMEQLQKDGYIEPRMRSWTLLPSSEMMPQLRKLDWTPLK